MNEFIKIALSWLKGSPRFAKIVVPLLLAALVVVYLLGSCSPTRAVVRTAGKGSSNASVSITTTNPISVDVSTKVDTIGLSINPKKRN